MKKLLTLTLVLLVASLQAQKLEKSLLWKISGKGIEKPSYLFGTIHMSCDSVLSPKVHAALDHTDQLYLELDIDDPNMQSEMMKDMMMKDGKTMSQLASEKDYKIVETFFKEQTGYSLQMFNSLKPFFISAMFYPKLLDCKMQSIEKGLMKISQEQTKKIFGLETVGEQMAVFDAIPYQEQMNELIKSAKNNLVNDKKEMNQWLKIYKKEDLAGIMESFEKSDNRMVSKYNDELLLKRNKNWIPKIEKIITEKPTFFGVGAAHLPGKDGIIMLLRKQGYKVEAVLK